jgi:hypothetical protein
MDRTYCYSANAKFHVITDGRHSAVLIPIADCYAVTQSAVPADDYVGMDEYVAKVIDPQSWAYLHVKWNTYSSNSF